MQTTYMVGERWGGATRPLHGKTLALTLSKLVSISLHGALSPKVILGRPAWTQWLERRETSVLTTATFEDAFSSVTALFKALVQFSDAALSRAQL